MTKTIATLVFALAVTNASAAGFQPWSGRGVDVPDEVQAEVNIGPFYRQTPAAAADEPDATQLKITFIPWYLQGGQI